MIQDTIATNNERAAALALCKQRGADSAAKRLGLTRTTLLAIVGGLPVRRGSMLAFRAALAALTPTAA